ncbi:MAG TPA: carboxypeptidase-like regulatory domain-containing protein, partial [Syntrophobacteraceae bacterium]|nr:carboxypeptidase-like regulatory domain-containing protein [Syntrophobacteraceae bacterium]
VPTAWNPNADQQVSALAASGGIVYAGGYITNIGGQARSSLAALDASTGAATSWNPSPDFMVNALAVSDDMVYVGGVFATIGGENRPYFAQFGVTYTISGMVTNSRGKPLSGAGVTLGKTSSATTKTALDGTYSFHGLSSGNYTVTAKMTGYTFKQMKVTIETSDIAGLDFSGTPAPTRSLSGL